MVGELTHMRSMCVGVAETGVEHCSPAKNHKVTFLIVFFSLVRKERKGQKEEGFDSRLGDADRVCFANRSIPRRRRLAKCPDPVSAHIRPTPAHLIMRACTHCPTHIQIRATPSPVFSFFRILRLNRSCDLYDGNAGRSGNCTCCRICRKCCRRHCYLIR